MKRTFEASILAYLDGSLGEREKEELLHILSVSPEKRALMEQHLKLHDALRSAQRPFSAPVATQRALASRIPVLGEEFPHLAPSVSETAQLATRAFKAPSLAARLIESGVRFVGTMTSQWSLQTGLAFAGSALVLGGVTYTVATKVSDNSAEESLRSNKNRNSVQVQVVPRANESVTYTAPSTDQVANQLAADQLAAQQTEPSANAVAPVQPNAVGVPEAGYAGASSTNASSANADQGVSTSAGDVALHGNTSVPTAKVPSMKSAAANAAVERNIANRNSANNQSVSNQNISSKGVNGVRESSVHGDKSTQVYPGAGGTTEKNVAQNANAASIDRDVKQDAGSASTASASEENTIIQTVALRDEAATGTLANTTTSASHIRLTPEEMSEPSTNSFQVYSEVSTTMSNTRRSDMQTGQDVKFTSVRTTPVIGVDYLVSNNIAVGLEAGSSVYSRTHAESHFAQSPSYQYLQTYTEQTGVENIEAYWTRANVRYTVNPESSVKVQFTGSAGSAFLNGPALNLAAGVGASYDVLPNVIGVVRMNYGAAWVKEQIDNSRSFDPSNSTMISGIIRNDQNERTLVTTALDLRVGFSLRM